MGHLLAEQAAMQIVAYVISTFLAAFISAVGVGGFIWKKLNANAEQDDMIRKILRLLKCMSKHQLKMSCNRAITKGCISLDDFAELKEFHDAYNDCGFNSDGDTAFDAVKRETSIREDCD